MDAGARARQAVELEGVGERAVGQRRRPRLERDRAGAEDARVAGSGAALGIGGKVLPQIAAASVSAIAAFAIATTSGGRSS
jgi:hypothetical protein